ncbi:hypothetical protein TCDM_10980 [Trypanosoma cruzi Dm28c]|uniref:Uncharacterized protein n=1 Tax=Trypanosoma cruzi Dm28c TaxID=1416333 RepID=V5AL76_TRYCR|nr:hypothetical protein TCDM_10980 [Trypanosoma cruzi Dm28c]
MHRGHPRRRRNQCQQNEQRRTHSRNGPAPHAVPAAPTRTHRRPHQPTQPGTNRADVVCRTRPVNHNYCPANPFLQMTNPMTRFRQIVNPLLLILILQLIPNSLKR